MCWETDIGPEKVQDQSNDELQEPIGMERASKQEAGIAQDSGALKDHNYDLQQAKQRIMHAVIKVSTKGSAEDIPQR